MPLLAKIVKSIFLSQFWADLGLWGVKSCARAFLTFSSLIHVKIRFREFFTAKIRFFHFFYSQNVKKHHFSNRRNGVRVSKNHDFSKIEFIHIFQSKSYGESIAKLKKMIGALENGVSSTFWQLFRALWGQKVLFLRIFDVFWRFCKVSIIRQREQALHGCTRIEKNQNRQKWA